MSDININQVLAQMRAMNLQASGQVQEKSGNSGFADLLQQSISSVNSIQQSAGKMAEAFETGKSNIGLADVMIATEKAKVSFQATLQIRNKLVEAYKDVMNMPM